ncbi:hypothetical protein MUO79_02900 [Candidatus Bathyarchaeota archaeon]|nr:hypothetical protein [Candidatus Bathyarchaeota archaeon]
MINKTGVSERVYYRHLKKGLEHGEIEEISEKGSDGRIVKKYDLKRKKVTLVEALIVPTIERLDFQPTKELLELAAWMKREPTGWSEDDEDVKKAKLCLEHCSYLVPEIAVPWEDPDSYVFLWPDEAVGELRLQDPSSSRFFDLKDIYDAMIADLNREVLSVGPLFVGAYCTPVVVGRVGIYGEHMQPLRYVGRPSEYRLIEEPQSVCVAVRKETDTNIRVVHVEPREGKLDKAWVSGLVKQLKAKKDRMLGYDSLKEDAKRRLLLNLRSVFEQRGLSISSRYASLIEDLWDYSYRKPSSGYVLALAIAVDLSSN